MTTAEQRQAMHEASAPLAEMLAGDEADENAERRKAVEALEQLYEARKAKAFYTKDEEKFKAILDGFFQAHPGERELFDDEKGYKAYFRSGGVQDMYDSPAEIKKRNPVLYEQLETLGCFEVDAKMVKAALEKSRLVTGDVNGIRHKVDRTASLMVEKTG